MQESQASSRPFAIVTSADQGAGLELAHQFAQNGFDLLIAANTEAILEVQDELEVYGTDVECIEVNLASFKGVEIFTETIKSYHRPVDVLVINASRGFAGHFLDTDLREEIRLINNNIISLIHLSKNLLGDMYDQGSGKIIFVSPDTSEIVCHATQAFVTSFAEAIRSEAKNHGVTISVIKGMENVFGPGLKAKFQDWATKVLPERIKSSYHRILSETNQQDHS